MIDFFVIIVGHSRGVVCIAFEARRLAAHVFWRCTAFRFFIPVRLTTRNAVLVQMKRLKVSTLRCFRNKQHFTLNSDSMIFTERALHVPSNYPDDSPTRILPFESSISLKFL